MANVSFLLNQFPAGGVERVTMNLISPLTYEKGHNIFIFVHILEKDKLADCDLPVTYIELPYRSNDKRNKNIIAEAIRKYNIDLFIAPIISPKYVFELRAEKLCKICYVLHSVPFYELKEMENSFKTTYPGERFDKITKKYLLTLPKFKLGYYHKKAKNIYKERYEKLDGFAVLNDQYKEMIANAIGTTTDDPKLFTLQNPIAPIEEEISLTNRKKRIIFVGRLSFTDKRVDRLLKIWQKVYATCEEWELMIIGDGPEKKRMTRFVEKHKLPRVQFVNFTSTPEEYYKESEILCLTSDFEGCPMVLLEAQQYGCTTIAFNCSYGVQDILSPNWTNGVHIPNGDIDAYAEALIRLMKDDELRLSIKRNGIENIKRFSIEHSANQYDAMIKQLTL